MSTKPKNQEWVNTGGYLSLRVGCFDITQGGLPTEGTLFDIAAKLAQGCTRSEPDQPVQLIELQIWAKGRRKERREVVLAEYRLDELRGAK